MYSRLALLPLLAVLALSACGDPNAAKAKALQVEIDQLHQNILQAQQSVRKLETQVNAAKAERQKLEAEKVKATEEKSTTESELKKLQDEFNAYKAKYKVSMREKVPGLQLEAFATGTASYAAVKVTEWTDFLIKFTHSRGTASLSLHELPESLKDKLGLSEAHEPWQHPLAREAPLLSRESVSHEYNVSVQSVRDRLAQIDEDVRQSQKSLGELEQIVSLARGNNGQVSAKVHTGIAQLNLRISQLQAQRVLLEVERTAQQSQYEHDLATLNRQRLEQRLSQKK
jgi:septal ring factor EnvC (AmiA/AmiB activator)